MDDAEIDADDATQRAVEAAFARSYYCTLHPITNALVAEARANEELMEYLRLETERVTKSKIMEIPGLKWGYDLGHANITARVVIEARSIVLWKCYRDKETYGVVALCLEHGWVEELQFITHMALRAKYEERPPEFMPAADPPEPAPPAE